MNKGGFEVKKRKKKREKKEKERIMEGGVSLAL